MQDKVLLFQVASCKTSIDIYNLSSQTFFQISEKEAN